ncbi:MAG: transglycosylase domain-containing protein [Pyrinomonadaceae bacterium]
MVVETKTIMLTTRHASARQSLAAAGRGALRPFVIFRRRALRVALFVTLAACAVVASALVYSYNAAALTIDERLAAGYLTSRAGIYAAPRVLRAGQNFPRGRLVETLRRAGYVEASASQVWSGAFVEREGEVEIYPRAAARTDRSADELGFMPRTVRVRFDAHDRVSEITGDDVTLASFTLEPEILAGDDAMKVGRNTSLSFDDVPPVLVNAISSIEDRRFFEHRGLDPVGIVRAALTWAGLAGDEGSPVHQGGSTITQQLVKNTYLTPERTLARKFKEAMLAFALERRLSKQDIFTLYCNEVYLGRRNATAVRGVRQAARAYFGKELRSLSVAEAATLAGMIQSPARFAPDRHPEETRARRNSVIAAMLRDGRITREDAESASAEAVHVAPAASVESSVAPYFVDYVNRLIDARLERSADADGRALRVQTTIDLDLQRLAEDAVAKQLARLEARFGRNVKSRGAEHGKLQAALVALDPRSGQIVAMVGGRDYAASQLNRATDALRQPGSVFKPVVYAAAIEHGASPVETFADAPRDFKFDPHAPAYRPSNYGGEFSMRDVTMRTALVKSLNVVTVDVALRTGLQRVANLAAAFGLPKPEPYPSLALGTTEATPLQIAGLYAALANAGARVETSAISSATAAGDPTLFAEFAPQVSQVVRPSTAYMITDTLSAVLDHGTARAARSLQKISAAAGKTGTSRDGWFAGYTPNLVCVVWVGYDDNTPLNLAGADSALPVWSDFMRGALELRPELGGASFAEPAGITTVEIDSDTGMLAAPTCVHRELVALTPALAPKAECLTHGLSAQLAALDSPSVDETQVVARPAEDSTAQGSTPATTQARRDETARADLAASEPMPANAARARTQIELNREGRSRLSNDLQLARAPDQRR